MNKSDFVTKLYEITDSESLNGFSNPFEAFSFSKNEFKGQVNEDGFKLRKRRKFFEINNNFAIATGSIIDEDGQLTINTEIKGFNNFMIIFYIFLIIFYVFFIGVMFFSSDKREWIFLPFIFMHGAFMALIPYFVLRRSVKRMKYDLERELFYLTKINM